MDFFKVDAVGTANEKLKSYLDRIRPEPERVFISESLGRVIVHDIYSNIDIPPFERSTVDGYAVISKDLFGAGESMPVFLDITGSVHMGEEATQRVVSGSAVYIPTGGMLPENADAVVMVEYAEHLDDKTIAVYKSVAPGEGIMKKGEDAAAGEAVLFAGSTVRPQDIGALAAIGTEYVDVAKKPVVTVFSTGDEIVSPFSFVKPGEIRDINSYVIQAMVESLGGVVLRENIVPDNYELLKQAVMNARQQSDVVVLSGGSSVGNKDMTARVLEEVTEGGILSHGLAMRPGKPTVIAADGKAVYFGLPGHPGSAAMVFLAVVKPAMEYFLCQKTDEVRTLKAVIDANLHSHDGKRSYQLVDIRESEGVVYASPLFGKSGSIMLMSRAKGYVVIPEDLEGIEKGALVSVNLF